jgi:hypothetical protein
MDSKVALALIALLLLAYIPLRNKSQGEYLSRLAVYALIPMLVWSGQAGSIAQPGQLVSYTGVFFTLLGICVLMAAKFAAARDQFSPNTMDFLLLLFVLVAGFVLGSASDDTARLGGLLVQVVILFYGCELFMRMSRHGSHVLSAAAALSVLLIALRTTA